MIIAWTANPTGRTTETPYAALRATGRSESVAGDPEQPIQHVVHRIDWASLSDEEVEAIEAFARAAERRHQIEQGARPQLGTDR